VNAAGRLNGCSGKRAGGNGETVDQRRRPHGREVATDGNRENPLAPPHTAAGVSPTIGAVIMTPRDVARLTT
jgi:hypothetical protein